MSFAYRIVSIGIAGLCSLLLALSVQGEESRRPHLGDDIKGAARRVISFWNIGGDAPRSGGAKRFREANPDSKAFPPLYMLEHDSWAEFIREKIEPEYKWGCRRWLIHNPFGKPYEGPMIFDQYLMAPELGLDYLVKDFVPAWRDFLAKHDDVEVAFYLGKMHKVDRFADLLPEHPDKWLERALASARPVLSLHHLGASLAFDAASVAPEGSPPHRFVQFVESMGVRAYIESWPMGDMEHWAKHNIVCAEQRRGVFAVGGAGVDRKKVTGEILWLVNSNLAKQYDFEPELDIKTPRGQYDLAKLLLKADAGYTVAGPVRKWMKAGLSLDELNVTPKPNFGFIRKAGRRTGICTIGYDGGNFRTVLKGNEVEYGQPVMCPKTGRILFASPDNRLHIVDNDGGEHRVVTDFPDGARWLSFDLTPDGRHAVVALCAAEEPPRGDGLYLVDIDKGERQLLYKGDVYSPEISPDGKRVAFESSHEGMYQIYTLDLETRDIRRISKGHDRPCYSACWSPDGTRVAFTSADKHNYIADRDGGNQRKIADMPDQGYTEFGPAGRRLAFFAGDKLYCADAGDGDVRRLTDPIPNSRIVGWSPDGCWIVVFQSDDDNPESPMSLKAVRADGKKTRLMTSWGGADR